MDIGNKAVHSLLVIPRDSDAPQMPEEVSQKLGEANLMYATRRYKEAVELLNDVIKEVGGRLAR